MRSGSTSVLSTMVSLTCSLIANDPPRLERPVVDELPIGALGAGEELGMNEVLHVQ